jgi:glucarate dehydratase
MKIAGMKFHKVNIPFEAPLRWSGGVEDGWTRCIIRMRTDDGIEGIGETQGGTPTIVQLEALKGDFIGEDPFNLEKILKRFWWVPFYHGTTGRLAISGLEMCCWDIMGKATGRPLCQLLGGRLRDDIPFAAYVFFRHRSAKGVGGETTPEEIVQHTRDLVKRHGFHTIKLKGGVLPPDEEYRTTAALREAFPDHRLRFDPNGLWSVETAIRMGAKFQALDLEYYEDPVWGLEGMSRARRDVRIPFATNMCVTNMDQLPVGIRSGAMDVLLGDPQEWGGVTVTKKAAATCQAFQIGFNLHSGGECGVSTATYLQVAASLPVLPYALDSHYHHQTADVITRPHTYRDGCFHVPEGPGLGVELNLDRLAELEEANRRNGDILIYAHDDEQRRNPPFQGQW